MKHVRRLCFAFLVGVLTLTALPLAQSHTRSRGVNKGQFDTVWTNASLDPTTSEFYPSVEVTVSFASEHAYVRLQNFYSQPVSVYVDDQPVIIDVQPQSTSKYCYDCLAGSLKVDSVSVRNTTNTIASLQMGVGTGTFWTLSLSPTGSLYYISTAPFLACEFDRLKTVKGMNTSALSPFVVDLGSRIDCTVPVINAAPGTLVELTQIRWADNADGSGGGGVVTGPKKSKLPKFPLVAYYSSAVLLSNYFSDHAAVSVEGGYTASEYYACGFVVNDDPTLFLSDYAVPNYGNLDSGYGHSSSAPSSSAPRTGVTCLVPPLSKLTNVSHGTPVYLSGMYERQHGKSDKELAFTGGKKKIVFSYVPPSEGSTTGSLSQSSKWHGIDEDPLGIPLPYWLGGAAVVFVFVCGGCIAWLWMWRRRRTGSALDMDDASETEKLRGWRHPQYTGY